MSDEYKKKPLVEAIAEVLKKESSEEISPALACECEKFEAEMKSLPTIPLRRKLRVRPVFLPMAHSYGEWHEGLTILNFPISELHGVLTGGFYYEPKTKVSYFRRRISRGGNLYVPKMKVLKRVLQ